MARIDFRSRFFAPRAGVAEDPVTGSAHCLLAPYWAQRLGKDPNGAELVTWHCLVITTCNNSN